MELVLKDIEHKISNGVIHFTPSIYMYNELDIG